MLYRPATEPKLARIALWLENWNVEADRFREAAPATRRGETAAQSLVLAAEEAGDGLAVAIDEIDALLDRVPAGTVPFAALLAARSTALSLAESIRTSLEELDMAAARPSREPRHTRREVGTLFTEQSINGPQGPSLKQPAKAEASRPASMAFRS